MPVPILSLEAGTKIALHGKLLQPGSFTRGGLPQPFNRREYGLKKDEAGGIILATGHGDSTGIIVAISQQIPGAGPKKREARETLSEQKPQAAALQTPLNLVQNQSSRS